MWGHCLNPTECLQSFGHYLALTGQTMHGLPLSAPLDDDADKRERPFNFYLFEQNSAPLPIRQHKWDHGIQKRAAY